MKKNALIVILAVVIAGGFFWGGMIYGKSKTSLKAPGNFANFSDEQRNDSGFNRIGVNGNAISGEIISISGENMTVGMEDGGSKIILFSDSTKINKFTEGTPEDLTVNENVVITGQTNSDGSVTAQTIQIRSENQ